MSLVKFLPCSSGAEQIGTLDIVPGGKGKGKGCSHLPVDAAGGVLIKGNIECPLSDLSTTVSEISRCPFHSHKKHGYHLSFLHKEVPFNVFPGAKESSMMGPEVRDDDPENPLKEARELDQDPLVGTAHTAELLRSIGGGDVIRELCTRFYARAFQDAHLEELFYRPDGATEHGKRLADWVIEKMGGEGTPWQDSGRTGFRQPSHFESFNNDKRPLERRGKAFKLDDCRIWTRLHFWTARECGLDRHKPFLAWYIQFIGLYMQIYSYNARKYTLEDAMWSADPENIKEYHRKRNRMYDIIGILY